VRIVLVRHGETEWSASGKHTSTTDLPLTDRGREAARRLPLAGRDFALVLASPRRRARETAELAGFEPETEPDLAELDYGDYEGRTTKEIRAERPGWTLWTGGAPGGETVDQVGARTHRVIARALAAGGDVALFAHGHVLRILTARWLELPPQRGASFALDTASVSELGFERETRVLWLWNSTAHLHAAGFPHRDRGRRSPGNQPGAAPV
jgi:broad specificity phosphatase PhoE